MAHYADLDENNIVVNVFVGKDEWEDGVDWEQEYGSIRTSYNTSGGFYYKPGTAILHEDQSKMFRYNFAQIGMIFDPNFGIDGAFYWPQPYPSWTLNINTAEWNPPIPMPEIDIRYQWDEENQQWEKL